MGAVRRHLTYANVTATLALFAAIGGGAYAAGQIGSSDVANNSLRSKDVKNQQLKGADIAPDSLNGDDIDESQLNVARTVQRANSDATVAAPPVPPGDPYPISAKYTQAGNETDLVTLRFIATFPPGCTAGFSNVSLLISDGPLKPDFSNVVTSGGSVVLTDGTFVGSGLGALAEPGSDTPRDLQGTVQGFCSGAGAPTVSAVRLAVIGSR
jgi:hypothetical protein